MLFRSGSGQERGQVDRTEHLHIADGSSFGAQSGIQGDIEEPGKAFMGSPAVPLRQFQRNFIRLKQLEDLFKKVDELEKQIEALKK